MKKRPWIWFIIAQAVFIGWISTLVVIAVKNRPAEVPVSHGH